MMNLAMSAQGVGDDDNDDGHYHIDDNFDDYDYNVDNVDGDDDIDDDVEGDDDNVDGDDDIDDDVDDVDGDDDYDDYVEVYRQTHSLQSVERTLVCREGRVGGPLGKPGSGIFWCFSF